MPYIMLVARAKYSLGDASDGPPATGRKALAVAATGAAGTAAIWHNRRMRLHFAALPAVLLLLDPVLTGAHHSWARYDGDHIFEITGTVTKVEWASPHVFMYFDAVDEDGKTTAWTMELDPPTLLRRYGLRHDTITIGMEIRITGVRAVSGAPMMRGVKIELPDGTVHRVSSRV